MQQYLDVKAPASDDATLPSCQGLTYKDVCVWVLRLVLDEYGVGPAWLNLNLDCLL